MFGKIYHMATCAGGIYRILIPFVATLTLLPLIDLVVSDELKVIITKQIKTRPIWHRTITAINQPSVYVTDEVIIRLAECAVKHCTNEYLNINVV